MHVAIFSNVNATSIVRKVSDFADVYTSPGYSTWRSEILDENSELYKSAAQVVLFLIDGYSLSNETKCLDDVKTSFALIEGFSDSHSDIAVVANAIDVIDYMRDAIVNVSESKKVQYEWNQLLANSKVKNLFVFDLQDIITKYGRQRIYSNKGWYLGSLRFSNFGEEIIVREIKRIIESVKGLRKKCIVLDLDNTLWGGVVGEVGIEGISLSVAKEGSQFWIFQKQLLKLKEMGILLAVCSKNNPKDAEEAIEKHPAMVLKKKDFVSMKINWNSKPDNISKLAKELNIGLGSMVFIDDSRFEREAVRSLLPEVTVPEMPSDSTAIPEWFIDVQKDHFLFMSTTEEDTKKTEMYQSQAQREALLKNSHTLEDYLESLDMKHYIWRVTEQDIPRAAQLTQKTNQFNLTTRRYTESQIREMLKSDRFLLFMSRLHDKFGDNGKIALMIIVKQEKKARVDSLMISCRVMGRYIENQLVDYIESLLIKEGMEEVISEYSRTARNIPVKGFWEKLGYKVIKREGESVFYHLKLSERPKRVYYSELIIQDDFHRHS